jgi:uncharacterized protein RhaS with RHS repeats
MRTKSIHSRAWQPHVESWNLLSISRDSRNSDHLDRHDTHLSYDNENRIIHAVNSNGTELYSYDPGNRRVYQKLPNGTKQIFFYGVNGDRLRTYQLQGTNNFTVTATNINFAGKLIR